MADRRAQPIVSFLICQTVCFCASFIGSQATMSGLQVWYQSLNKPAFNPPGWVFAPVWTILYFLMGVALWQVWNAEPSRSRAIGLVLFGIQLVLNALWSWLFFAWHMLAASFIEIVVLDIAILATIVAFAKVRKSAAWLLSPYLAWCCFATLLTFSIWQLNKGAGDPRSEQIQIKMVDPESGPLLGN